MRFSRDHFRRRLRERRFRMLRARRRARRKSDPFTPTIRHASKAHRCQWCGCDIAVGTAYRRGGVLAVEHNGSTVRLLNNRSHPSCSPPSDVVRRAWWGRLVRRAVGSATVVGGSMLRWLID